VIVTSCGCDSPQPCGGDAHEPRVVHLAHGRGAAVAHRLPQPTDELVRDRRERPLVGYAPLDPFGNELVHVLDVSLEVAVLGEGTRAHRAERTHAAVLLEALALHEHHFARRLFGSGEHRTEHHRVRTRADRFRDVARRRDATVGDQRHVVVNRCLRAIVDRRHLRHADARDDARRAAAPRPHSCLHRVRARVDQCLRSFTRRDVAGDKLDRAPRLDPAHDLEHARRVAVSGVDDEDVCVRVRQRLRTLDRIGTDADGGAHAKSTLLVLRRVRMLDLLLDVLDRDQTLEPPVAVDHGQLLDLVAVKDLFSLGERRADRRSHKIARSHQRGDRLRDVVLEAQVAVGQDADEHIVRVDDRHTADVVSTHQIERVRHKRVGRQRHRLDDHSRLAALDLVHLGDLILDREVAVNDPDAAFARERDRQARLRDGVHRRRDERDLERDAARDPRRGRYVVRQDARLGGNEQYVVECQAFLGELLLERQELLELLRTELDGHERS
jgi:hypothetical protein